MKFNRSAVYLAAILSYAMIFLFNRFGKKKGTVKTVGDILNIEDSEKCVEELREFIFKKAEGNGSENLNEHEKMIYALDIYESGINRYGFYEFFYNNENVETGIFEKALETIGADESFNLLMRFNDLFDGKKVQTDMKIRQREMDDWKDEKKQLCNSLDGKFYNQRENISYLLYGYITSHRDDFCK